MAEIIHSSYFNEEDDKLQQNMICLMLDDSFDSSMSSSMHVDDVHSVSSHHNNEEKKTKNKVAARRAREKRREEKANLELSFKQLEDKNAKLKTKVSFLQKGIQEINNIIGRYTNTSQIDKIEPIQIKEQEQQVIKNNQNFNIPNLGLFDCTEKYPEECTDSSTEVPRNLSDFNKPLINDEDILDLDCLDIDLKDLVPMDLGFSSYGSFDPIELLNQTNEEYNFNNQSNAEYNFNNQSNDLISMAYNQVFTRIDSFSIANEIPINLDFIQDWSVSDIDHILSEQAT